MGTVLSFIENFVEGVVFGNGFLALGGIAVAVGIVVLVKVSGGLHV